MTLIRLSFSLLVARPWIACCTLLGLLVPFTMAIGLVRAKTSILHLFEREAGRFHYIVGVGNNLAITLSALYQAGEPAGNLSDPAVQMIVFDSDVVAAFPLSVGDTVRGKRLIGTASEFVDDLGTSIAAGRIFQNDFEIVAGSIAANDLALAVGDLIQSSHGLSPKDALSQGNKHLNYPFRVVGILSPTGSPFDHSLFTTQHSYTLIHQGNRDAVASGGAFDPTTYLMIRVRPNVLISKGEEWRRRLQLYGATAVRPSESIQGLVQHVISPVGSLMLSYAIAGIAAGCLGLISTFGLLVAAQRRELAVMRALGARPSELFMIMIGQGTILLVLSAAVGLACRGLTSSMFFQLLGMAAIPLPTDSLRVTDLWLAFGYLLAGSAATCAASLQVYRLDVISILEGRS